jgi:hypothetical protein
MILSASAYLIVDGQPRVTLAGAPEKDQPEILLPGTRPGPYGAIGDTFATADAFLPVALRPIVYATITIIA